MSTENDQTAEEDSGLDAELGAIFDEVTKEPESEVPEEKVVEVAKEPEPEPTEEPIIAAEEVAPAVEEPSEEVVAPASWTAESKESFSALAPAIQQEVLKREKDFQKGLEKNAGLAKQAEAYDQVISPYKAMIAAEGGNPVQAVQNLLNSAYRLRSGTPQQKGDMIRELAKQYGAELGQTPEELNEDEYIDPDIKALRDQVTALQNQTQSQMDLARNNDLQNYQVQIDQFKADPANVHFDKVSDTMSALMQAGQATTLKEAYDKSIYIVEDVRTSIIQDQIKQAEVTRVSKETAASSKAKKAAGLQLTNEESGIVAGDEGTMEEEMSAIYDKAQSS